MSTSQVRVGEGQGLNRTAPTTPDPAGIAAEEEIQLPARDARNIKKARKKRDADVALGGTIRREAKATRTDNQESKDSSKEKS